MPTESTDTLTFFFGASYKKQLLRSVLFFAAVSLGFLALGIWLEVTGPAHYRMWVFCLLCALPITMFYVPGRWKKGDEYVVTTEDGITLNGRSMETRPDSVERTSRW